MNRAPEQRNAAGAHRHQRGAPHVPALDVERHAKGNAQRPQRRLGSRFGREHVEFRRFNFGHLGIRRGVKSVAGAQRLMPLVDVDNRTVEGVEVELTREAPDEKTMVGEPVRVDQIAGEEYDLRRGEWDRVTWYRERPLVKGCLPEPRTELCHGWM